MHCVCVHVFYVCVCMCCVCACVVCMCVCCVYACRMYVCVCMCVHVFCVCVCGGGGQWICCVVLYGQVCGILTHTAHLISMYPHITQWDAILIYCYFDSLFIFYLLGLSHADEVLSGFTWRAKYSSARNNLQASLKPLHE